MKEADLYNFDVERATRLMKRKLPLPMDLTIRLLAKGYDVEGLQRIYSA